MKTIVEMNSQYATRQKNGGQAVLWFLALIASISMVFVGVYSIGQLTSEKQKITNATDAAAYSGALVQARALNMMAYGNRMQIANEVLVAQALSIQSWAEYNHESVDNAKTVMDILAKIPYVNFVAAPLAAILGVMEGALEAFASAVNPVVDGVIFGEERVFDLFNIAGIAVFTPGAMQLAANEAAKSVLAENYDTQAGSTDRAPVSIRDIPLGALNAYGWDRAFAKYTKTKTVAGSSDGRIAARDILLASRDEFSAGRKGPSGFLSYFFGTNSLGNCVTGSIGSSRDGSSELKDYERWEMQDTSRFEYELPGQCKGKPNSIPFGWGRATAADQETKGDSKTNPHDFEGLRAYSNTKTHSGWSGVKALFDVERDTTNGRPDQDYFEDGNSQLIFHFAAKKPPAQVRTNAALGFLDQDSTNTVMGNPRLKTQALKDGGDEQLTAIAAAQVFFARPQKNSLDFTGIPLQRGENENHKEVASLYSPYWQVRLTTPSNAAMIAVYATESSKIPFSQSR